MNIRILATAAIAAISISLFAQGRPPAGGPPAGGQHGQGGMHRGMPDDLKKQLNLSPAQENKLKAIREKYQAKLKAAGFDPSKFKPGQQGGTRPNFEKLRPIFEAQRKEMDAVYTPKQKEILKKYMETHMRRGPGGPGGPGGPPRGGGTAGGHGGGR